MKRYDFFEDREIAREDKAVKIVAERFWKMRRLKSETIRSRFLEAVFSIQYFYNIHKEMGGIGGCVDVEAWRASDSHEGEGILSDVKELICIFCEDNGFYERDFLQWVMELIVSVQANYAIGG